MSGLPLNRLDVLEEQARQMFRLIGPRVSAAQDERFSFSKCNICSPPEKVYTCYICQFSCQEHWQYWLHVNLNPEYCQRYAKRWVNKYANS